MAGIKKFNNLIGRIILQKIFKTAIVGGGAAGLLSAVELLSGEGALKGEDVVILEKNDRVGKKLIATGNGQGNLTNVNMDKQYFYGDKDFISAFIKQEKELDLKSYLEKFGVPLTVSKDGKVYPLSKQASSVLDVVRAYLEYKKCVVTTGFNVVEIKKNNGVFIIKSNDGEIISKTVVIATGGSAAKQFGTDGSAYKMIEKLGHTRTKIYPSLVQLKTDTAKIRALKGLKETVNVTAYSDGKKVKSASGEILFTEFGVSGSAIFQVSAGIADKENASLSIEFLPELNEEEISNILYQRKKTPYIKEEDLLSGILNKRVGQAVLKTAKSLSVLDVVQALKNFTLTVTGTLGFNYAQVTRGGIKTDKINPYTMESKIQNGVYIVGETLDVDGDCGGYNLTFAFVSGIIAARAIKKNA